jgi:hypothetical protein
MRQPEVCKHQVCDHCGGGFGMVTYLYIDWSGSIVARMAHDLRGAVALWPYVLVRWLKSFR